jgi:hypothetical protein
MGVVLSLAFLVLIGPLSYFFGVDSRRSTDRGWVGAARYPGGTIRTRATLLTQVTRMVRRKPAIRAGL